MKDSLLISHLQELQQKYFHGESIKFFKDVRKLLEDSQRGTSFFTPETLPYLLRLARIHGLPSNFHEPLVELLTQSADLNENAAFKIYLARLFKHGATGNWDVPFISPPGEPEFSTFEESLPLLQHLKESLPKCAPPTSSCSELVSEILIALTSLLMQEMENATAYADIDCSDDEDDRDSASSDYEKDSDLASSDHEDVTDSAGSDHEEGRAAEPKPNVKRKMRNYLKVFNSLNYSAFITPEALLVVSNRLQLLNKFANSAGDPILPSVPKNSSPEDRKNALRILSGQDGGSAEIPTPHVVLTQEFDVEATTIMGFSSELQDILQADLSALYEKSEFRKDWLKSEDEPVCVPPLKRRTKLLPPTAAQKVDDIYYEIVRCTKRELSHKEMDELIEALHSRHLWPSKSEGAAITKVAVIKKVFATFALHSERCSLPPKILSVLLQKATKISGKVGPNSKYTPDDVLQIVEDAVDMVIRSDQLNSDLQEDAFKLALGTQRIFPHTSWRLRDFLLFRYRYKVEECLAMLLQAVGVSTSSTSSESSCLMTNLHQLFRLLTSNILDRNSECRGQIHKIVPTLLKILLAFTNLNAEAQRCIECLEKYTAHAWSPPLTSHELDTFNHAAFNVLRVEGRIEQVALWTLVHSLGKYIGSIQYRPQVPTAVVKQLLTSAVNQSDRFIKLAVLVALGYSADACAFPRDSLDLLMTLESSLSTCTEDCSGVSVSKFVMKLLLAATLKEQPPTIFVLERACATLYNSNDSDERIYSAEILYEVACKMQDVLNVNTLTCLQEHIHDPVPDVRIKCRAAFAQAILNLRNRDQAIPVSLLSGLPEAFTVSGLRLRTSDDSEPDDFTHVINSAILDLFERIQWTGETDPTREKLLSTFEQFVSNHKLGIPASRLEVFQKCLRMLGNSFQIHPQPTSAHLLKVIEHLVVQEVDENVSKDCVVFITKVLKRDLLTTTYRASQSFLELLAMSLKKLMSPKEDACEVNDPTIFYLDCLHLLECIQQLPDTIFQVYYFEMGCLRLLLGKDGDQPEKLLLEHSLHLREPMHVLEVLEEIYSSREMSSLRSAPAFCALLESSSEKMRRTAKKGIITAIRDQVKFPVDFLLSQWHRPCEESDPHRSPSIIVGSENKADPRELLMLGLEILKNQPLPLDFLRRNFKALDHWKQGSSHDEPECIHLIIRIFRRVVELDHEFPKDLVHPYIRTCRKIIMHSGGSESDPPIFKDMEVSSDWRIAVADIFHTLNRLLSMKMVGKEVMCDVVEIVHGISVDSFLAVEVVCTTSHVLRSGLLDRIDIQRLSDSLIRTLQYGNILNELGTFVEEMSGVVDPAVRQELNLNMFLLICKPDLLTEEELVDSVCNSMGLPAIAYWITGSVLIRLESAYRRSVTARRKLQLALETLQRYRNQPTALTAQVAVLAFLAWLGSRKNEVAAECKTFLEACGGCEKGEGNMLKEWGQKLDFLIDSLHSVGGGTKDPEWINSLWRRKCNQSVLEAGDVKSGTIDLVNTVQTLSEGTPDLTSSRFRPKSLHYTERERQMSEENSMITKLIQCTNLLDLQEKWLLVALAGRLCQLLRLREHSNLIQDLLQSTFLNAQCAKYSLTLCEILEVMVAFVEDRTGGTNLLRNHTVFVLHAIISHLGRLIRSKTISCESWAKDGEVVGGAVLLHAVKNNAKFVVRMIESLVGIRNLTTLFFFAGRLEQLSATELALAEKWLPAPGSVDLGGLEDHIFKTVIMARFWPGHPKRDKIRVALSEFPPGEEGLAVVHKLLTRYEKLQKIAFGDRAVAPATKYDDMVGVILQLHEYQKYLNIRYTMHELILAPPSQRGVNLSSRLQERIRNYTELSGRGQAKTAEDLLEETRKSILEIDTPTDESIPNSRHLGLLQILTPDILKSPDMSSIYSWTEQEIKAWACRLRAGEIRVENTEIFQVIQRALVLDKGWKDGLTQIQRISVMLALNKRLDRGQLQQVVTGCGKSTVIVAVAVAMALRGKKVDVYTSSPVLAQRDSAEWSSFYEKFGLKCDHNVERGFPYSSGRKKCYDDSIDIVYGDMKPFQFDALRQEYAGLGTRGNRPYDFALVDEADSIYIDDSGKLGILGFHIPGMELLTYVYHFIWSSLQSLLRSREYVSVDPQSCQIKSIHVQTAECDYSESVDVGASSEHTVNTLLNVQSTNASADFDTPHFPVNWSYIKERMTEKLEKFLDEPEWKKTGDGLNRTTDLPKHIQAFAQTQVSNWVSSAIMAEILVENEDYLVDGGEIKPVDLSTGVVQSSSRWTNGLHQFLQIKHSLRMTPETAVTNFMSNKAMLSYYGHEVIGFSGTLGSRETRDLLEQYFDLDSIIIPNPFVSRYLQLRAITSTTLEGWTKQISEKTLEESRKNRAVLVICKTVVEAELVYKTLSVSAEESRVLLYVRNDQSQEHRTELLHTRDIIVTTNLGTRGMNIKVTPGVNQFGGLHVILTYLPSSSRIEQQAFGRTARYGCPGTGQFIILHSESTPFAELVKQRDAAEVERLQNLFSRHFTLVTVKDQLFAKFKVFLSSTREQLLKAPLTHHLSPKEKLKSAAAGGFAKSRKILTPLDAIVLNSIQELWAGFIKKVDDGLIRPERAFVEYQISVLEILERHIREPENLFRIAGNCYSSAKYGLELYRTLIRRHKGVVEAVLEPTFASQASAAHQFFNLAIEIDPHHAAAAYMGLAYLKLSGWDQVGYVLPFQIEIGKSSNGISETEKKTTAIDTLWQTIRILLGEVSIFKATQALHSQEWKDKSSSPLMAQLSDKIEMMGNFIDNLDGILGLTEDTLRPVHVTRISFRDDVRETVRIFGVSSTGLNFWDAVENDSFELHFRGLTARRDVKIIDQAVRTLAKVKEKMLDERARVAITVPFHSVQSHILASNARPLEAVSSIFKGLRTRDSKTKSLENRISSSTLYKFLGVHGVSAIDLEFRSLTQWETLLHYKNTLVNRGKGSKIQTTIHSSAEKLRDVFSGISPDDPRFSIQYGVKRNETVYEVKRKFVKNAPSSGPVRVTFDLNSLSAGELERIGQAVNSFNLLCDLTILGFPISSKPHQLHAEQMSTILSMNPSSLTIPATLVGRALAMVEDLRENRFEELSITIHNLSFSLVASIYESADRSQKPMQQLGLKPWKDNYEGRLVTSSDVLNEMEGRGLNLVPKFKELQPIPYRSIAAVGVLTLAQIGAGVALTWSGFGVPLGGVLLWESKNVRKTVESAVFTREFSASGFLITKVVRLLMAGGMFGLEECLDTAMLGDEELETEALRHTKKLRPQDYLPGFTKSILKRREDEHMLDRISDVVMDCCRSEEIKSLLSRFYSIHSQEGTLVMVKYFKDWLKLLVVSEVANEIRVGLRTHIWKVALSQTHDFGIYLGAVTLEAGTSVLNMIGVENMVGKVFKFLKKHLEEHISLFESNRSELLPSIANSAVEEISRNEGSDQLPNTELVQPPPSTGKAKCENSKDTSGTAQIKTEDFNLKCVEISAVVRCVATFIHDFIFQLASPESYRPSLRDNVLHDLRSINSGMSDTVNIPSSIVGLPRRNVATKILELCDLFAKDRYAIGDNHSDSKASNSIFDLCIPTKDQIEIILKEVAAGGPAVLPLVTLLASTNDLDILLLVGNKQKVNPGNRPMLNLQESPRNKQIENIELRRNGGADWELFASSGDCLYEVIGSLCGKTVEELRAQAYEAIRKNSDAFKYLCGLQSWFELFLSDIG